VQIRRAEIADEHVLGRIRRDSILGLAGPATSMARAEVWANGVAADRFARAIREHDVWIAVETVAIGWIEVDRDRVAALYVSLTAASRGVGSALLSLGEEAIRGTGHAAARLEASENALSFYLRRGYIRSGPLLADGSYPLIKDLAAST